MHLNIRSRNVAVTSGGKKIGDVIKMMETGGKKKPVIDAEGGEDLNLGLFLKTPLHFTLQKLYSYLLHDPCFQGHKASSGHEPTFLPLGVSLLSCAATHQKYHNQNGNWNTYQPQ